MQVQNETYRKDGTLATRVIDNKLYQYDREGQVTFVQNLQNWNVDVTYHDGQVATITIDKWLNRTVTQYDDEGHATVSLDLGKHDVVNFSNGYISSVVKYVDGPFSAERDEIQYGENGRILSSTHQTKIDALSVNSGNGKWLTTQHTTYYSNNRMATVVAYKQRTKRKGRMFDKENEDIAESYVSQITQYDESGKTIVSLQFHEFDEVNFHPSGRIASVLRKDENNEPKSLTSYDENGKILNIMVYKDGVVISSTDYNNAQPSSNVQLGDAQYQNIFDSAKKRVAKKSANGTKKKITKHETVVER